MRFDLLKILLVDDNHHMRVLLTEILRAIGVRHVFEATDGAEALQLMRSHQIDIIMSDLAMQPLDGIDFVRLLRNSPDSPNPMAPVIMITGHSTMKRVNEARDVGVNEFMAKPITASGVIGRLQQIIDDMQLYPELRGKVSREELIELMRSSRYEAQMLSVTAITGSAQAFMDTPSPAMMFVPWPVCDAAATCLTGPYSVPV